MKHLTSDEIRQRFIQYFKELEEGQGHQNILFEDQLLPIIAKLSIPSYQYNWLLPFLDILKVRQTFRQPSIKKANNDFFKELIDILSETKEASRRKRQFLHLISKKIQIKESNIEIHQMLSKKFNEKIKNKKPILDDFIFKLYQHEYTYLKVPNMSKEVDEELFNSFLDKEEQYIRDRIQIWGDIESTIIFIFLKKLKLDQQVKQNIINLSRINYQFYYNYLKDSDEPKKKEAFNKLCDDQYFIDIILMAVTKSKSGDINEVSIDKEFLIYSIQSHLQRERKEFIIFYLWDNPEKVIDFLKEYGFISLTDKKLETGLVDKKLTHGELVSSCYEQRFFIDPLKQIIEEKGISFDEAGFYQRLRNKEKDTYKYICQLPIYILNIAFLLADRVSLSHTQHGPQLKEQLMQLENVASQLNLSFNKLTELIEDILNITKDHYPPLKNRYLSIRQDTLELFNEIKAERAKEQEEKEKKEKEQQKKGSIFHLDFLEATHDERCKIVESYGKIFENRKTAKDYISAINHFLEQEGLTRTTSGIPGDQSKGTIKRYRNQVESFNQWLLLNKGILIKTIRIKGFRGLENIEVDLEKTTVLTGANNTGKSSILHALEVALGHRFVSQEDFFIKKENGKEKKAEEIVVDLFIIPININNKRCEKFSKDWDSLFNLKFKPQNNSQNQDIKIIHQDNRERQFVSLRTKVTFDDKSHTYEPKRFIIPIWPENKKEWFNENEDDKTLLTAFADKEMPFFYIDGQRDILKDIQSKTSYLGKMLSKTISFEKKDYESETEKKIKELNQDVIKESDVLRTLKDILQQLSSAMGTQSDSVDISLFTRKIRDLYKGLSIYYTDQMDTDRTDISFPMEYHGMGTRSWSSLLTLKALIKLLESNLTKGKDNSNNSVFFPIVAIEEPEAHLHPSAQKRLYHQIDSIEGQKIISTHSPYVAAATNIKQVRNLYKDQTNVVCGQLDISQLPDKKDQRKIERQVMKTRGEILFSKLIILCEGETEEQALPIFAKKYPKNNKQEKSLSKKETKERALEDKEPLSEIGLNVIGVDGHGNYKPFLQFAKAFHIPFVILSDAEENTITSVQNQIKKVFKELSLNNKADEHIVFLNRGESFETHLIDDGYDEEFKKAIIILKNLKGKKEERINSLTKEELKAEFKKEKNRDKSIRIDQADFELLSDKDKTDWNDLSNKFKEKKISKKSLGLKKLKAQLAPILADQIINNEKSLPLIVQELFDKAQKILTKQKKKDNERPNETV